MPNAFLDAAGSRHIACAVLTLVLLAAAPSADAEWTCDDPLVSLTANDLPAAYFVANDWVGSVVPDGAGGLYLVWEENAAKSIARCRIQRLDANGNRLWGDEGLMLFDMDDQHTPGLFEDSAGGVYAYTASSPTPEANFEVRMQRFGPDGSRQWGPFGRTVFQACGVPSYRPHLVSDGADGFFLSLVTNVTPNQVRLQHISANGDLLWGGGSPCGIVAVTSAESVFNAGVLADGAGGLFLSYDEFAGNGTGGLNVRAERLDASGNPMWGSGNGISVCNRPLDQFANAPLPDGEGGVLVFWYSRNNPDFFDYVGGQRLDGNGNALWTPNGEQVLPLSYYLSGVMADGQGGAWISVWKYGADDERDNHLQRVDRDGNSVYPSIIPICEAPNRQFGGALLDDRAGGCYVVWSDWRDTSFEQDLYFQHVSPAGAILEPVDGTPITAEPGAQGRFWAITSNDQGEAFIVWDNESPFFGIFAEKFPCTTTVAIDTSPASRAGSIRVYPNPFGTAAGSVRISFDRGTALAEDASIEIFDVTGRNVRSMSARADGRATFDWDGKDDGGRDLPAGVYWVRVATPNGSLASSVTLVR
ncbi:MAG: FlgD immunoglobulin-like domain containing protein [bacterium]